MFNLEFPVDFKIGSLAIHPHQLFELLAYLFGLNFLLLRKLSQKSLPINQLGWVIIGALVGAILGSKILVLLQHIDLLKENWQEFILLFLLGKTIVGGLLGGLIGVEITKKIMGITRSTGDVFVYPLIVGTTIGRIGCFLTGLSDRTYGIPTNLPWGVDFGDGIYRHPTQIYEIIFLLLLMVFLQIRSRYEIKEGDLFKFYMIGYLGFRFFIDFLKPNFYYIWGLSAIQTACLIGLVYYYDSLNQLCKFKPKTQGKSYA